MNVWSKPFHGIQHYPSNTGTPYTPRAFRASVQDRGSYAECNIWTPGCGFSPICTKHPNAEEARKHGEHQLLILTKGEMGVEA